MKKMNLLAITALSAAVLASSGCSDGRYSIGVLLPVSHQALEVCEQGFKEGLKDQGLDDTKIRFVEKNANGSPSDMSLFAKDLVSSCDMTFGLGTDCSKLLKSSSIDKGITNPVLFSAVTDPVDAGLVKSLENGEGFCTGTTDAQPVDAQIALIKEIIPDADKIGIMYTQSETNSKIQADQAVAAAEANELETTVMTVSNVTEIAAVSLALASVDGIDAIYIPTDNNIASAMNTVKQNCNSKNVLIVAGEENMLASGGHVSLSVNYLELGKMAGKMAAEIVKGNKKAYELPVKGMSKEECEYVYSSANLVGSTITLPESFTAKARDISK